VWGGAKNLLDPAISFPYRGKLAAETPRRKIMPVFDRYKVFRGKLCRCLTGILPPGGTYAGQSPAVCPKNAYYAGI
jgi:hypothetical protein